MYIYIYCNLGTITITIKYFFFVYESPFLIFKPILVESFYNLNNSLSYRASFISLLIPAFDIVPYKFRKTNRLPLDFRIGCQLWNCHHWERYPGERYHYYDFALIANEIGVYPPPPLTKSISLVIKVRNYDMTPKGHLEGPYGSHKLQIPLLTKKRATIYWPMHWKYSLTYICYFSSYVRNIIFIV